MSGWVRVDGPWGKIVVVEAECADCALGTQCASCENNQRCNIAHVRNVYEIAMARQRVWDVTTATNRKDLVNSD
jgi:hypothetical protein